MLKKKSTILPLIFLFILLFQINSCKKSSQNDSSKPQNKVDIEQTNSDVDENTLKPSKLKFEADTSLVTDYAILSTTLGHIKIALFGDDAPNTVNNFIGLAQKGNYNGLLFHRVAKKFLIQTGDPNTRSLNKKADWGKGGKSLSGKEFEDEFNTKAPSYKSGYYKGVVAMANRGPNTNTSQFFICLEDAKAMETKWTIFGKVVEGLDVVEKISSVEIEPGPFEPNDGVPKKPVKLYSVSIVKAN